MSVIQAETEFSRELHLYLMEQGYTHILCLGVSAADETEDDDYYDDYRLRPLKQDDPRLQFEEADYIIEPIGSNEVYEMSGGDEFIRFIIELPVDVLEQYLKSR